MSTLSLEAILYQGKHNALVNGLVHIFEQAIQYKAEEDYPKVVDILNTLPGLIKEKTGMYFAVSLTTPGILSKSIGSPYNVTVSHTPETAQINVLNPVATKRFKEGDLKSFKVTDLVNGRMDFNKVFVTGFYQEVMFEMKVSDFLLDGKVTAEQLSAIVLHELGHAWTILASMGVGVITSSLAAGIMDFFNRYDDPAQRAQFGKMVSKSIGSNVDHVDEKHLISAVVTNTDTTFTKVTGLKYKSNTVNEQLADQFASQWGMGLSLAEALRAVYDSNSLFGRMGVSGQYRGMIGTTRAIIMSPWMLLFSSPVVAGVKATPIVATGVVPVLVSTAVISVVMACISFTLETLVDLIQPHGRHPTLPQRVESIRRDQIALLRTKLSKAEKIAILDDIDAIDKVYKDVVSWDNVYHKKINELLKYIWGTTQEANYKDSLANRNDNLLYELKTRLESSK